MTVYIVGKEIVRYSYADCVDQWFEEPHLLGIFTNREDAIALANEYDAVMQEVETDVFLNDHREVTCNYDCLGEGNENCENCKHSYDILNDSGISII